MQTRTTLILLVIAVLLASYIVFFERHRPTTAELSRRQTRVLEEFNRESVNSLALAMTGQEKIKLLRHEDDWKIESPKKLEADPTSVESILTTLDYLSKERVIEEKGARSMPQFGFADARLNAEVGIGDETIGLVIGNDAGEKNVYLALEGQDDVVYVVSRDVLESLGRPLDELRSRELVDIDQADISQMEIAASATGGFQITNENGVFWLRGPPLILADDRRVREITAELAPLTARRFVADDASADDMASYGLDSPVARLQIEWNPDVDGNPDAEGKKNTHKLTALIIGRQCRDSSNETYASIEGSGTVVCISDRLARVLSSPAESFRDMRLWNFRKDDVSIIRIQKGDAKLHLGRDDEYESEWMIKGDSDIKADSRAVSSLLSRFLDARAVDMVDTESAGADFENADMTVSISVPDSQQQVDFVRKKDRMLAARKGGGHEEDVVLMLPGAFLDQTEVDALAYRDRKIIEEDSIDANLLVIDGKVTQTVEKKDGTWRLISPVEAPADGADTRELVSMLCELEAVRFVSDEVKPAFGLEKPAYVLNLAFGTKSGNTDAGKGAGGIALEIGTQSLRGDGYYARLASDKESPVFIAASTLVEKIEKPLLDRTLLQIEDAFARKVVIEKDGKKIVLSKHDDEWESGDGRSIDSERVHNALQKLATSRTLAGAGFGPATPLQGLDPFSMRLVVETEGGNGDENIVVIEIGAPAQVDGEKGYYARKKGVDATVVIPSDVADLFRLL